MARTKKPSRISILNWMATLLVCAIPGVNLVALILILIFARTASKRNYAWALLIWILLLLAAYVAVALLLPDRLHTIIVLLRQRSAATVVETVGPLLATPAP